MANAAFSAIVLHAIGGGLASTKYALVSSIGNFAPVYLTAFDGWLHDTYGIKAMLIGETLLGITFILVSLLVLAQLKIHKQPSPEYIISNVTHKNNLEI
jgi:hypothetical protein